MSKLYKLPMTRVQRFVKSASKKKFSSHSSSTVASIAHSSRLLVRCILIIRNDDSSYLSIRPYCRAAVSTDRFGDRSLVKTNPLAHTPEERRWTGTKFDRFVSSSGKIVFIEYEKRKITIFRNWPYKLDKRSRLTH